MGLVVTVAQQKGGAGKTSLAAHLACAWGGAEAKPRRKMAYHLTHAPGQDPL